MAQLHLLNPLVVNLVFLPSTPPVEIFAIICCVTINVYVVTKTKIVTCTWVVYAIDGCTPSNILGYIIGFHISINKLDIGFVPIDIIGVSIGKLKGFDPYQYGGIMIRVCCCLSFYVILKHFLALRLTINKIVEFIIIGV